MRSELTPRTNRLLYLYHVLPIIDHTIYKKVLSIETSNEEKYVQNSFGSLVKRMTNATTRQGVELEASHCKIKQVLNSNAISLEVPSNSMMINKET